MKKISQKRWLPAAVLCLTVCLSFIAAFGRQEPAKEQTAALQEKKAPEKVIPAPKDIKERTGILVFMGWLWAAIFVLIYILRLKVKEADRLYRAKYFDAPPKT
jgi:hypothetical protein